MIRILHFVPDIGLGSGIASFLMSYYRAIDKTKIQFDFIYFNEYKIDYKREIEQLGGRTILISRPNNYFCLKREISEYLGVNKGIYNILHNHLPAFSILLAPIIRKYNIKHLITHNHITKYSDKKLSAVRNMFMCIPVKLVSHVWFACSADAGVFLFGKKAFKANKVFILNNAIDCKKFEYNEKLREEFRSRYGLKGKTIYCHIGRFENQKNHKFLIRIFEHIVSIQPGAHLLLVGSGALEDEVHKQVNKLGLNDRIEFLGLRNDISTILSASDVMILPSIFEGLGIVTVEAQTSGLEVLVSDRVPQEAFICDMDKLSLNDPKEEWAKKAVAMSEIKKNRNAYCDTVLQSVYSIAYKAGELERKYLSLADG